MVCVGCNKRNSCCSKGCLDYLLESLVQPKEIKIHDSKAEYTAARMNRRKNTHTYLGGK